MGSSKRKLRISPQQDAASGAIASAVTRTIISPLDVLKIRFQITTSNDAVSTGLTRSTSLFKAARLIVEKEGVGALWKGNLAAQLMGMPYGAISFTTYRQTRSLLTRMTAANEREGSKLPPWISTASGATAAITATICTYPFDLLRTRMAAQREPRIHPNLRSAAMAILRQDGLRGFYAGQWPTLVGVVPYMAIQFMLYEGLKAGAERANNGVEARSWQQFGCGFCAGIGAKLCTLPLDVAKKRLQVETFVAERNDDVKWKGAARSAKEGGHKGVLHFLRYIYRSEGMVGLFSGGRASLAKAGPNSALIFLAYEQCSSWFERRNLQAEAEIN